MGSIKNSPKNLKPAPVAAMNLQDPNEINRLSPWEIDFRQIEAGAMETKVSVKSGTAISLLKISMSRAVHQTGVSPSGMLSVGVVAPKQIRTWQGADSSSAKLLSFGSSDPFDGVSVTGFEGTTISIGEGYAEILADNLGLPIPETLRTSANPNINGSTSYIDALSSICRKNIVSGAMSLDRNDEEEVAMLLLLSVSSGSAFADKSSPRIRSKALALALDLMRENLRETLTISQICREAGVSWRTLDRAFAENFGISPKTYFQRLKLNRARSEIQKSPESVLISDVANSWGFWHMGQFALDYAKMFGELPSATRSR